MFVQVIFDGAQVMAQEVPGYGKLGTEPPPDGGGTPEPPIEIPPGGNPATIVPPWGVWDEAYPKPGFAFQPGQVHAFPVPANPNPNADGVTFTLGQTPSQAPKFGFEFCLSQAPGVIDPTSRDYINWPNFSNSFAQKIYTRESAWNAANAFKAFPGQPWYWNVRLTGSSVQSINSPQWTN